MEGAANNPAAALEDLDLEMEALFQTLGPPFNKPHELIRQGDDFLVAIASVEELNAALAAAPQPIKIKGVIRGYVLPTASYKDCLLLKAAAEEGLYRCGGDGATPAVRFGLADHAVVDAKMSARASVDEARAVLGVVVSSLAAIAITPAGDESTSTNAAALAADTVESVRREVQQSLESTIAHIKALRERLDSI